MALFKGEKPFLGAVTNVVKTATTGQISPNGVTLTNGDVLLMMYVNTSGNQRCVVVASGDTLTIR